LQIPRHLQAIQDSLALRRWITSKKFPLEVFFAIVDRLKELATTVTPNVSDEMLANLLAPLIDADGGLLDRVLDKNTVDIRNNPGMWEACTQAAAWVVLQQYYGAVEDGKWPHA
jgi:hypothetical protein